MRQSARFTGHGLQKTIHLTIGTLGLITVWLAACLKPFTLLIPTYVTAVSAIAFIMVAVDKRRARRGQFRLSECSLHLAELLGGWPGALIAQVMCRHKNQKTSFLLTTWTIIALHAFLGYVLWRLPHF